MELAEPDPDIQVDVNLMILDYLLCMTLETIISTGQVRNGECDSVDSSITTIYAFERLIPDPELIPEDIHTKVKILQLADRIRRCASPTEILCDFAILCCTKRPQLQWAELASQLIAQGAMNDATVTRNTLPESLEKHITMTEKTLSEGRKSETATHIKSYLEPPAGTSLEAHIERISTKLAPTELRHELFNILLDIMKTLDPPILVQLERGKLPGLSRAETQQLKDRVGIR